MLWLDEHKVSSPHSLTRAQVHGITLHNLLRHLGFHHVDTWLGRLSNNEKEKEKEKTTISQ